MDHKILACLGTLLLSMPSVSTANTAQIDSSPFESESMESARVTVLDEMVAWQLRGRFAPLPLVMGVTSLDLALTGLFWGVYVPYYTDEEGPVVDQVIFTHED
jgi:hypothetical protein